MVVDELVAAALRFAADALLIELRRTLVTRTKLTKTEITDICNTVRFRLEGKQ